MSEYVFEAPHMTLRVAVKEPLFNLVSVNECIGFDTIYRNDTTITVRLTIDKTLHIPLHNIICMITEMED